MRYFFLWTLLAAAAPALAQSTIHDEPLSERRVSYTIDASLDPDARTVRGVQRMTWRNPDAVPVQNLQFHLYLNAFRDNQSTFMRESGGVHRGNVAGSTDPWGGIDITSMRIAAAGRGAAGGRGAAASQGATGGQGAAVDPGLGGAFYGQDLGDGVRDLTDAIRYIHPDDDNENDRTVIEVELPRPVQPGETIALDMDFVSRIPEIVARTGWVLAESGNPFFMIAQWFPKVGVYEVPGQRYVPEDAGRGAWSTHQFHANSEFYADFGTYDVSLTVPAEYIVGASGIQIQETTDGDLRTVHYLAEDVHDFAWTASPDFQVHEDTWEHVSIRLLLLPWHDGQVERHLQAARISLEKYAEWVGEYPYTTLTVVDAIGGANGMEYPTLITAGTSYGMPEWIRMPELVTVHEFGHQYFYGMLASNEAEEAWLDEGMNSYLETRIMDEVYGGAAKIGPMQIMDREAQRLAYVKNNPSRGALVTRSWDYRFGDYAKSSYAKPATVMTSLERHLGWEVMKEFLQTYYQRWRFRHPTTRDLQEVAEDVSGEDLNWFFDQYVYGTAVVDYSVEQIINRVEGEGYQSTVRVQRRADGTFPLTLRVTFEDDTVQERYLEGLEEWVDVTFQHDEPVAEAYLDPEFVAFLDTNRLNNRLLAPPHVDDDLSDRTGLRMTAFMQKVFFVLAGMF